MSNGPKSSQSQAAPWARLRAWIDEKEAWEQEHNAPAPLTPQELAAIANLVSFVPEPDIGDKDHVSALLRYVQGRRLDRPTFADEGPVDITVNGLTESRWRCFCSLPFIDGRFPRVGHGFGMGEEPPVFKSKKNAKQFAAQQALEFLEGRPSSPARTATVSASAPSPTQPQSKKAKTGNGSLSPILSPGQAAPKPKNAGNSDDSGTDGDGPSIFQCVARLATRLGLDQPVFRIEPDGDLPNFYRGWAEFRLGSRVPRDLGLVRGVLGKTEAKVRVAEKVHVWLQEEHQARKDTVDSVLSRASLANQ